MKMALISRKPIIYVSMLSVIVAVFNPSVRGDNAPAASSTSIRGFSDNQSAAESDWEAKMRAVPKPELLREYMKRISAQPHHVGSEYDHQNAEFILGKFKEWDLTRI